MDNKYGDDYTGSYIPRGPPSYADSNPGQVNSYSGSIPKVPPSYSGSIPRSFDHNEKDFSDENKSYESKDMNNRYPAPDNRGQYTPYRDSDHESRSNRPGSDRYYSDRERPPAEPPAGRHDEHYGRDSYDDHGSYSRNPYNEDQDRGRDGYYDERSDSYNGRPVHYRDNRDDRDSGSNRDRFDRYDDRPMPRVGGGRDYPQYSDDSKRPQDNGFNPRSDLDDVRLDEREENAHYTAETGNVELAYAPPEVKDEQKNVLQNIKAKSVQEKWKQKPAGERRKYCVLCTFLILAALAVIIVPMAIYVRLWHKLTWKDIRELQVKPRDIKWGQQGRYVYYRDFSNNVIRVDLTKKTNKLQQIIFKFETWNKVGYDDFDVTGPGTMLILVKNNGVNTLVRGTTHAM